MAYQFGSGVATITPAGVSNPTPLNIGLLQEISVNSSRTLKELHGQYADAIAIGAGTRKWTGKAKVARFGFSVFNALYLGATASAGTTLTAVAEAHAVPAATPFTVTVTNSATFTQDQGVVYAASGQALTRVATVAAGKPSFNASRTSSRLADRNR